MRVRSHLKGALLLFGSGVLLLGQQQPLKLDELVSEALRSNPEILAAQKRYEAARQRPTQESSLPDPMLSLGYSSTGSPRPLAGIGVEPMANAGLMVSQEVPFPGKRKLRGDIARKEADADFELYQGVQLNVVSRLKQAYYRLYYAYAASDVLERNRDLLRKLLRITEARYSVGRAAQQDVYKTQTELSILETRLVDLNREREARVAEINSVLNRPPGSPLARPAEVEPKQIIILLDEMYAAARENSPMLQRDQKMIERTELALNLARKDYYPDYVLSGGYFNQGGMADMWQFRVDFKLPAYFWRKQRAAVTEQAQNLSQSRRTYESTNQALHFRIKDDYLMATTSWRLMELYGRSVVPQATLALESSLASYETGNVDFLSVLTNYVTAVNYEVNYFEEMQNYYVALSRLEEMTAMALIK
ncbi:MAG: TolC family protein [Bryobacterales bacterium]|nr:TolC family protein [Bryobacterales bacterium]